ncbi:S8 family peptidase [Thermoflavimicrobium daqui]|uniref:Peptidase S8 n=1 Tax=Thermoflavimicrobium daqui TaxID=2137476 RepID=A0A364K7Z4_9BACL|nr:S8 family peptidase [Thermoflavimicrobium daqui]RAL26421.1 peptidase S8 [Thermoflavimicrobium daqui]
MKRIVALLSVFSLGVSLALPSLAANATEKQTASANNSKGEIVVKFKKGLTTQNTQSIHQKKGGQVVGKNKQLGFEEVKIKGKSVDQALQEYKNDPQVEYAEKNVTYHATWTPNDPYFSQQYALKKVNAEQAWDVTRGSSTVKIAIVDTGVDYNHPDLAGKVDKGYDFVNNDNDPMDQQGHGTHCAGIAAAVTNNAAGIAGMAPNVRILAERVLDANGSGTLADVADGITHAADAGAKVISLSLGGSSGATTLQNAVSYASSKGAVVVAAAGNSNTSAPSYPAYYSQAIAVAATDQNDRRASFSNYGSWVDVAAPGVSIMSTYPGNTYRSLSGTSMATPLVAGLAGLLASQGKSASTIRSNIESSADKISGTGTYWTHGRVNANNAVRK